MMVMTTRYQPPKQGEYHEYYDGYVSLVDPDKFEIEFKTQPRQLKKLLGHLEPGEDEKLHEPYTWSLKQVLGHLIDCERIFSTRLFRIAAGDESPIPGIDQNAYVDAYDYKNVSMKSLLKEFRFLRKSNIELAKRTSEEALARTGTASDHPVSARANLYILVGHVEYHMKIMKQRLS